MPTPTERVRDAVNDIQHWLSTSPNPGEAVVRQAVVLRLLQAAGFDIWDPVEVVPEETNATGNRADFLIRAGEGKFALEIKGMGVTLGAVHFQQAATYAVNEGTRWAIVTNGRVWLVIDEHLPGRWEERVALRVELAQEGHTFADDLATLLDAETWRANAFAGAVETVQERQRQRRDEARIHKEKRPVVETTQEEFSIATFEKATAAAVQMGRITEAERAVLLGRSLKPRPTIALPHTPPQVAPDPSTTVTPTEQAEAISFFYRVQGAEAHATYQPTTGTWTVKAGSTALRETKSYAERTRRRREQMLKKGDLEQVDGLLLRYVKDVKYSSPSGAADDISGASENGWRAWKDSDGRPAEHYRPSAS